MPLITTDIVIDAVRATRDVYLANVKKLVSIPTGPTTITREAQRLALMDQLLNDDNACEMLAGRLHQISSGTSK